MAAAIINPRPLNIAQPTLWLTRRQQLILRRMGAVMLPEQASPVPHAPPAPAAARSVHAVARSAALMGLRAASAGRDRRASGSETLKNREKMGCSA